MLRLEFAQPRPKWDKWEEMQAESLQQLPPEHWPAAVDLSSRFSSNQLWIYAIVETRYNIPKGQIIHSEDMHL